MPPLVILGCTASGKSDLAEALAARTGAILLAVDSMQVYRGMDIGTAKPSPETRARIPHLMIDVADPWDTYSAARFAAEARPHIDAAARENRPLILIGGTILYLRALIEGLFEGPSADPHIRATLHARAHTEGSAALHQQLASIDPAAATRIHPNDLRRIVRALEVYQLTGTPITTLQTQWAAEHPQLRARYLGIRRDKDALNRRINARVKTMMASGLLEEVDRLRQDPRGFSPEAASAVGYKELLAYFAGRQTPQALEDAVEQIKIQTRHLAKMQRTWLKRWPPAQSAVHWLDAPEDASTDALLERALPLAGEP
ncbi:MAG TPA: tRNA (adenosine(37)-N6)-dimethylallyltransferase MiaA [Phycisphaerae bacterium]|nr:tRNA (adenosine(37)-N6)-dimethylallyltransferase MiaA [Phycisphaerae bacterium]